MPQDKRTEVLFVRLTKQNKQKLERLAAKQGVSLSAATAFLISGFDAQQPTRSREARR